MFFITTDIKKPLEGLFSKIFDFFDPDQERENIVSIKIYNYFNCVFYGCKKVELKDHTVFISGNIFPNPKETLRSSLENILQQKMGGGGGEFTSWKF